METPGDRFSKFLKKWLKDFSKTKYAIPAVIALTGLIYYLVITFLTVVCLSNLVAPLIMLAMLWKIGIKSIRRLLLIGAIATLFFSAILTVVIVTQLQHMEPVVAESEDGQITATLEPWFVDKGVPFTFNLTATLADANATVNEVRVRFIGIGATDSSDVNLSLNPALAQPGDPPNLRRFTLTTTTSRPVNQFIFKVNLNGTWVTVGEVDKSGRIFYLQGPIFKDSWALAGVVAVSAVQIDYFYVFGPYAIILLMIWWTRRARRMREKQVEKWQAEQAKEDAKKPKSGSKVPSLDAAMGKVEEGFVCSECGADVPADATVCPKCGEKFE